MTSKLPSWASSATPRPPPRNSAKTCWPASWTRQAACSNTCWIAATLSTANGSFGGILHPALRSDAGTLRILAVAVGLAWAAAFVVISLGYQLQLYADGSMFSYAVAVEDVWAFHWHNIAERISVFILSLWPAELLVGLTGSPFAGVAAYGVLF